MLDSFLSVACSRSQKEEEQVRLVEKMRGLPDEYLLKLASGEEKLAYGLLNSCPDGSGPEAWLDRFKGTPLFEQALELEKQDLQERMAEQARYREEDMQRSQRNAGRDELMIQRKLLELNLAELESGGGEPPVPEEMPQEELPMEEMQSEPPVPPPQAQPQQPAPREESPKTAAPSGREVAEEQYAEAAGGMHRPTVKSVRAAGDPMIADEASRWADTNKEMQETPGKFRISRGVAGGIGGGLLGAGLGSLAGKTRLGMGIGAGLGAIGGAAAPVDPTGNMQMVQEMQALSPEERDELASKAISGTPEEPGAPAGGRFAGSLAGLAGGIAASYSPRLSPRMQGAAPLLGAAGGMALGHLGGKLYDKAYPAKEAGQKLAFAYASMKLAEGMTQLKAKGIVGKDINRAVSRYDVDPEEVEMATPGVAGLLSEQQGKLQGKAQFAEDHPVLNKMKGILPGAAMGAVPGALMGNAVSRGMPGALMGAGIGALGGGTLGGMMTPGADERATRAANYGEAAQTIDLPQQLMLAARRKQLEDDRSHSMDVASAGAPQTMMINEQKVAAEFRKVAIGLGMLGSAVAGGAKSIAGGAANAFKATRGFGGSIPQAGRMALGAAKGQAPGALQTMGRAATSYAKANPLQAAGLAGAAGLGTGMALS